MWIQTEADPVGDPSLHASVGDFRSGCDMYIELLVELRMPFDYLLQVTRFFRMVWAHEGTTDECKITYIKEFMALKVGTKKWADEYQSNYALMSQFLPQRSVSHRPAKHDSKRKADRESPARSGSSERPKKTQVCHSYSVRAKGSCKFENCHFLHSCASCHGDHPASECLSVVGVL